MTLLQAYIIASTALFIFFGAIWKTNTTLNTLLKLTTILLGVVGVILAVKAF